MGKKSSSPQELKTNYYKGLLGRLYLRGFRDCGGWLFSTCNTPDVFPFLRDRVVKGADPDSFVFVGSISKLPDWTARSDIYKDKNHVIIYDEVIPDSDSQSIQVMDGYAKDKNNIYMYGSVFKNLDISTFEFLSCGFFRDASSVYSVFYENGKKPLNFVDKDSFEMVNREGKACNLVPYIAKDKNNFYQSDSSGVRIVESNSLPNEQ
ncbi:DKNYY domain-containing protein [Candidatus Shapirobacteria bacterium]|nr:DKNYY domain-containing protein [Candidatus Shapirobacteria bacterium]